MALVGDESVHVLGRQRSWVVAVRGSVELQEGAQLQAGSAHVVEGASAARAVGRTQDRDQVIPDQVPQPALGHSGQVEADPAVGELAPEVLGEDVAEFACVLRRHVESVQGVRYRLGDVDALAGDRRALVRAVPARIGQRAQAVGAAVVGQPLQRRQLPPTVGSLGVPEHAPLDLGAQQRMQPAQVDLRGSRHCRRGRAPSTEGRPVGVLDRRGSAGAFVAVAPLTGQHRPAGAVLIAVVPIVAITQPQRGMRPIGTDPHQAVSVARGRLLGEQPVVEVADGAVAVAVVIPPELVVMAELEG